MSNSIQTVINFIGKLYAMKRSHKLALMALFDALLVPFCLMIATSLRLDSIGSALSFFEVQHLVMLSLTSVVIFKIGGLYDSVVRHDDHSSYRTLLICVIISCFGLSSIDHFMNAGTPRSVVLIYGVILFSAIPISRSAARLLLSFVDKTSKHNILILGADTEIIPFLNALKKAYPIVGIISNNPEAVGSRISGIRVFPSESVQQLATEYNNCLALISQSSRHIEQSISLIDKCLENSIPVKYFPTIKDLIDSPNENKKLFTLSVNDLLNREAVKLNTDFESSTIFHDKVILVTGAGGSIGGELCKQLMLLGPSKIILLDISELGLYTINQRLTAEKAQFQATPEIITVLGSAADRALLEDLFTKNQIFCVFHAGAYKHVPLVEANAISGIKNNLVGTKILLDIAKTKGVERFVFISSDKAVRPSNIMGASKRLGELLCQTATTEDKSFKCSIVRFGNVLGSSGSVVPLFDSQISNGGPVTITDKQVTRYFMTVEEAVRLVLMASSISNGNEIFVLDMGTPVKIIELAEKMIRLRGFDPVIVSDYTDISIGSKEKQHSKSIAIKFVGLRPGEKLHEELFWGDDTRTTKIPRVYESHENFITEAFAQETYQKVFAAIEDDNIEAIKEIIGDRRIGYRK